MVDTQRTHTDHRTVEEIWQEFDGAARRHLHMSGEEFLRRWDAGEFGDADGTPAERVAALLPRLRAPGDFPDELTIEQSWRMFDGAARRYAGMSGEEFLRRWDAGEFPDPDGTPIMRVVASLPLAR